MKLPYISMRHAGRDAKMVNTKIEDVNSGWRYMEYWERTSEPRHRIYLENNSRRYRFGDTEFESWKAARDYVEDLIKKGKSNVLENTRQHSNAGHPGDHQCDCAKPAIEAGAGGAAEEKEK